MNQYLNEVNLYCVWFSSFFVNILQSVSIFWRVNFSWGLNGCKKNELDLGLLQWSSEELKKVKTLNLFHLQPIKWTNCCWPMRITPFSDCLWDESPKTEMTIIPSRLLVEFVSVPVPVSGSWPSGWKWGLLNANWNWIRDVCFLGALLAELALTFMFMKSRGKGLRLVIKEDRQFCLGTSLLRRESGEAASYLYWWMSPPVCLWGALTTSTLFDVVNAPVVLQPRTG